MFRLLMARAVILRLFFPTISFHSHPVVQVILESLRMASIISFTFREAVADVEYKGTHVPGLLRSTWS